MFDENSFQWYEVIVDSDDLTYREFVIEHLIQLIGSDYRIVQIYDSSKIPSEIFVLTSSVDYLKRVREKYFIQSRDKPSGDLHNRFKVE